jgi:hypothetical protein
MSTAVRDAWRGASGRPEETEEEDGDRGELLEKTGLVKTGLESMAAEA